MQQPMPQPRNSHEAGQQLLDAINALPEKLAGMLNEKQAPKPAKPAQAATTTTDTAQGQQTAQAQSQQPGKRSFAEWWFGG